MATSIIASSPSSVNYMIGSINTVDESKTFLTKLEAHLFITDLEKDVLLYLPLVIWS